MSKFKPKMIAMFGLVAASISALVGGGFYFANQTNSTAKAAANVVLYPGDKALFTVEYSNGGDNTEPVSALLNIFIGDKLDVDLNSFKDSYDNGPRNCLRSSLVQTTGEAKFTWGYLLQYRPRSATNGLTNCNGEGTAGIVDLAPMNAKKGAVTFEARLRPEITDPAGTVLNSNFTQGVKGNLVLGDGRLGVSSEASITVARRAASSSSSVAVSSTISSLSSSVASSVTSSSAPAPSSASMVSSAAPVNKVVTPGDIDTAYCNPDPLTIGQKAICYFRLKDQGANYTLPDNTKAGINTAGGPSDNCSLVVINSVKLIECRNTPSDGGTPGSQKIRITVNNQTDDTKGNIMLVQSGAQTIKGGRLYFIGLDNKQLNWDESVRYNLNFPINQKFKDGNVKLVFDQIGEDANNLWTTGTCNFTLSAHTLTTTYRTYQGNIVGGKCEANYPVSDQTTYNYTHVVVRATKPDSNKIITDTNVLVLYVGRAPVALGGADLGN